MSIIDGTFVTSTVPAQTRANLAVKVLFATGIEKSFGRGMWPLRHRQPVLRGASLTLMPGEAVGLVGRTTQAKAP